uniref:Uncharacterized protein n=1 Tax=Caenorhabditis japonica TaxID=281687 RepID=A0A8R1ENM5_CAEJA
MALKTKTQDFPELEGYLSDLGTSNVFIKNVSQFLLEVEALPTQFATKANRFKDIGEEFTKLKKVPAIPLDFVGLTSIIEILKCSSFGLSDELNNAEESLEGLSLLQYSSQPLDEHITEKLVKTEKALRNLFGKAVTLSPSCGSCRTSRRLSYLRTADTSTPLAFREVLSSSLALGPRQL